MKKALITGIRGQDGAYLAELLLSKGYEVYGADRRSSNHDYGRLNILGIAGKVKNVYMDLLDVNNINTVIKEIQPDEIYNLAAQSFVKTSFDQPLLTCDIDGMGVLRLLEAIKCYSPHSKFYQASTSEMFGKIQAKLQNEETPFYPRSPYGVSKLFAHWITKNYRESYGIFACSGILFNHESPLRGLEFITRKITNGVARIKKGLQDKITVGNIDAMRDWGFAKEYVEGMWLMLQQEIADDYVLATGKNISVREFITNSFNIVGITIERQGEGVNEKGVDKCNGNVLIDISPEHYRPAEVEYLIGDASKAERVLGRKAQTDIAGLTKIMVDYDMSVV